MARDEREDHHPGNLGDREMRGCVIVQAPPRSAGIPDLRHLSPDREAERWRRADAARLLGDVALPRLAWWNYDPCEEHAATGLEALCPRCGGVFRRHQRTGVTWLWLVMKGLLGDPTGTGKTI